MKDNSPFELPSEHEKLSYKFILDSLKEEVTHEDSPTPLDAPPETAPIALQLDLPIGKKYFRIGEVSEIIGVEPYVLRYWEGEFRLIKPVKSGSGHRVYRRKDVEALHLIRYLLHVEKFSIKGAKKQLQDRKRQSVEAPSLASQRNHELLKSLAHDLKELIQMARGNPGGA